MKALIIDDEVNNIENLQLLLSKYCPEVIIAATASSASEGKKLILAHQPDLIFLDIQMPDQNGFDLLKSLPYYSFELIFVTGYDKYGIQAIRFSAIDYLLKPIDKDELISAVNRAKDKWILKKQNHSLENLMKLLQESQKKNDHRIALPSVKETRFVKTAQIVRCEADNNYTIFYLNGGEKIVVSKPMFEYDEMLSDYGFIRCHHSHLVNKIYIKSWIREDGDYLLLDNGTQIPISRLKKDLIKEVWK